MAKKAHLKTKNPKISKPMTDPWCWYIYANINGILYIDGIHGAPYIAAPWIRHGKPPVSHKKSMFQRPFGTTGRRDRTHLKFIRDQYASGLTNRTVKTNGMVTPILPNSLHNWLVVYLHLWKMIEFVSWEYDIPNIWKKWCSKPPTR